MASQVEIEIADGAKNLIHKLTMLGVTLTDREKALGKALFRFIATRERWDVVNGLASDLTKICKLLERETPQGQILRACEWVLPNMTKPSRN